ncbi:sugar ABC transporter substrate-binding protein [Faecalicatena contorta]|uniref:ABC transporter substrate-binding protein n=1 Tax=Faecalicatena contorta TaxID=39482 RepID=UPI002EBF8D16|nr:extracellular solute-binding protein [Muricomes sp.]
MKKKIVALLLTAVMAGGLIACGSGGKADTPKDEKTSEESGKGDSLTVWCWDPAFSIVALEEAEAIYQKENPDFELNIVETPWEDVQTKLTTAATSGDLSTLPDILLIQDNAFQKNTLSYPDAFVDLTDSGIQFNEFSPGKVGFSTVDGKNYGVPFDNGTCIGCYRTDYLEQAGLTIDDFTDITWDQYIENGKKVLEATGKPLMTQYGGEPDLICEMLQSAGASMFNDDGSANLSDNEVLEKAMGIYAELVETGVLQLVNDWNAYVETITKGNVAGTINGCWILGTIQSSEDQAGKWAITNMPKMDGVDNATNYSSNGGSSWAVTSNSENPDLAIDFLNKTFAGSVEFYENILPSTGALTTYLPAGDSEVYAEPQEFFNGDAIYEKITKYAGEVPSNITGMYYFDARDAVATALSNVVNGADISSELKTAEETVEFSMGK